MSVDNRTQIIVAAIGLVGAIGVAVFANWEKLTGSEKPKPAPAPTAQITSPSQSIGGNNNVQISGSNNAVNSGNLTQNILVDKRAQLPSSTAAPAVPDVQALLRKGISAFHQAQFSEAQQFFEAAYAKAASQQDQHLEFAAKSNLLAVAIVQGSPQASVLYAELTKRHKDNQSAEPGLLLVNIAGDNIKTIAFVGPSGEIGPNAAIVQAFYADTGEPAQTVRLAFPEKAVNWVKGTNEGLMISLTFSEKQLCLLFIPRDDVRFTLKRVPCI